MVLYRYYVPLHPQENMFSPQTKTYVMYVWLPSITKHVYIEALNHSQARYSVTIQLHFKICYISFSRFLQININRKIKSQSCITALINPDFTPAQHEFVAPVTVVTCALGHFKVFVLFVDFFLSRLYLQKQSSPSSARLLSILHLPACHFLLRSPPLQS